MANLLEDHIFLGIARLIRRYSIFCFMEKVLARFSVFYVCRKEFSYHAYSLSLTYLSKSNARSSIKRENVKSTITQPLFGS